MMHNHLRYTILHRTTTYNRSIKKFTTCQPRRWSSASSSTSRQQNAQHPQQRFSYAYASPSHLLKMFGVPEEASDKISILLAGVMGATAALGMVAAVVTSAARIDNCYGGTTTNMMSSPPALSTVAASTTRASHNSITSLGSSSTMSSTKCEGGIVKNTRLLRKKKTLIVANDAATASIHGSTDGDDRDWDDKTQRDDDIKSAGDTQNAQQKSPPSVYLQRLSTREEINKIRANKEEILRRWERDEEGFRKLPARAWPPYQPGPEQLKGIVAEIKLLGCGDAKKKTSHQQRNAQHVAVQVGQGDEEELCTQLLFDMATALVFYNLDAKKGLDTYRHLASERDHVDSMVACGIVLTEGLGVDPNEKEGISWLQRAISKDDNPQALYELGTLYYTGLDGVLDEDPTRAFELFERAAAQNHTGAMYMVADCLVEGEGCTKSVARAVPLFYKAAERGHRYSRQRIRELLAKIDYPF